MTTSYIGQGLHSFTPATLHNRAVKLRVPSYQEVTRRPRIETLFRTMKRAIKRSNVANKTNFSVPAGRRFTALDFVNAHIASRKNKTVNSIPCAAGTLAAIGIMITPAQARAIYYAVTGKWETFTCASDWKEDMHLAFYGAIPNCPADIFTLYYGCRFQICYSNNEATEKLFYERIAKVLRKAQN